ncbi:MAG: meso-butanediol dehydrogenase/(S,S)-butanediol dehydrogenase/diacetyl reductase [Hyphomicrobiaceae bacterium]|jgi:meso-butanediol dehydrogenase/(S,S)-butanediol dehydrogenase/diacetyl reductase
MRRFDGKSVFLTGAASGIGRATALRLAEEGARLLICDVSEEGLAATASAAARFGGEVVAELCDVSDEAAVKALIASTAERFGGLDVLANVAGIIRYDNTHELALSDWNRVLAVNLTGTFLTCREALPHLLASGGNIVNVASIAATSGQPWAAAYAASKGGVLALTYNLAVDYAHQGLRANAILPGGITSGMTESFYMPDGVDPKLLNRAMPMTGLIGPEAISGVIAMVASSDGMHINGESIRVDGATKA